MKRSIMLLFTFVSLSISSMQGMQNDCLIRGRRDISIPLINKTFTLPKWSLLKRFCPTIQVNANDETSSDLLSSLRELYSTNSEFWIDVDRDILKYLNFAIQHLSQGENVYSCIINLAQFIGNNPPKDLMSALDKADYIDDPIIFNALVVYSINSRCSWDFARNEKGTIRSYLYRRFCDALNRWNFYLRKTARLRSKITLSVLIEDGIINLSHNDNLVKNINEARSNPTAFEYLFLMEFDQLVAHLEMTPKEVAIKFMIEWLKQNIDFGQDQAFYKDLFNDLPENYVKMAMRFLYADANNGQLIDELDINNIRGQLSQRQHNINLCNVFSGNNDPLFKYIMTFIELAKPLYDCDKASLSLGSNQFTALPAEIGKLTALTYLSLSRNQFTALPAEIGKLTALTHLILDSNQLTALPAEIRKLTALTCLSLDSNQLTALPAEIGNLSALTLLHVNSNQLTILPAEIGKLTALTDLFLDGNQLTVLPAEIGKLTALTWLRLSSNQLTVLPAEIGKLTALKMLQVNSNQLTILPNEIENMNSLMWLDFANNHLSDAEKQRLRNIFRNKVRL